MRAAAGFGPVADNVALIETLKIAVPLWLAQARQVCLALWLEHETPRQVPLRRLDVRRHRGPVPQCGTPAALRRHRTYRETGCQVCAPVERAQTQKKRAGRKAQAGAAT